MFSSIKNFICRHRKKFIVSGVIVGGSILLTKYAQKKFIEWQDKETKDFLERTRKHYQLENTERTCNQTILSLATQLKAEILKIIDSDSLLFKLKNVEKNKKLAMWDELKVLTLARHAALLYCGAILSIVIRVQVNMTGGIIANNIQDKTDAAVQQDFLSVCEHFIHSGCKEVCRLIESHVRSVCSKISLKSKLGLKDLEHIFWSIQAGISDDNFDPFRNLPKYVFSKTRSENAGEQSHEVNNLLTHTIRILEKEEVSHLGESCVGLAFSNTLDSLAEYFVQYQETSLNRPGTSEANGYVVADGQLTHPASVNMPVAKIIPIVHGLTNVQNKVGQADTWIYQFLIMDKISDLGRDVFNSFAGISD